MIVPDLNKTSVAFDESGAVAEVSGNPERNRKNGCSWAAASMDQTCQRNIKNVKYASKILIYLFNGPNPGLF